MVFIHDLTQWAPSGWHGLVFGIALQNIKKLSRYVIIIQCMPENANCVFEKPPVKFNLVL